MRARDGVGAGHESHDATRGETSAGASRAGAAPLAPTVAREVRRAEVARRLGSALLSSSSPKTVIAASMGVKRQRLDDFTDEASGRALSVADLRGMPLDVRRELVGWLAEEMGCALAELPPASSDPGDDLAVVARVQAETSEAVAAHLRALSDGHVDRREANEVVGEIDEAIGALLTAKHSLMRAAASHGRRVERSPLRAISGSGRAAE